ncbi:MAG: hypothetical protein ABJL99_17415 [Aliishimia sp.]
MKITEASPPANSLIMQFATMEAHYSDGFCVHMPKQVDLSAFITAFYKTPLFRAERLVLRLGARAPSSDDDVDALAAGQQDTFAIWTVEGRRDDEILLGDSAGRTKSWLHVAPNDTGTQLWFGSVVVPVLHRGKLTKGPVFDALLGAHKVYSRMLLGSAAAKFR